MWTSPILPPARGKACTPYQSATGEGQIVLVQAADLADTKRSYLIWQSGSNVLLFMLQPWHFQKWMDTCIHLFIDAFQLYPCFSL